MAGFILEQHNFSVENFEEKEIGKLNTNELIFLNRKSCLPLPPPPPRAEFVKNKFNPFFYFVRYFSANEFIFLITKRNLLFFKKWTVKILLFFNRKDETI